MSKLGIYFGIAAMIGWSQAKAIVITDFDDLPSGTVVTNQYSDAAVFSSSIGHENYAVPGTASQPNMLCSGAGGIPDCLQDTYVDFTIPLYNLQMIAVVQNSSTDVLARFNIFEHGVHTETGSFTGQGHPGNFIVQFNNRDFITRLEIVEISAPIGWDNFGLTQVPEPTSLICLVSIGYLAIRRRCR